MEMEIAEDFPFLDPFDEHSFIDVSSFLAESPALGFAEPEPLLDPDDPLQDPFIWSVCNGTDDYVNGDFSPSGFYEFPEECNGQDVKGVSEIGDDHQTMPLAVFPEVDCSYCQRLRLITHTRGMNVKRLEIHGSLGIITHAILEIFDSDSGLEWKEYQMFDFEKEATQNVKWFLLQYMEVCKQEGYNLEQDPLSNFYEALSVGVKEYTSSDQVFQLSQANTGSFENDRDEKPMRQQQGCTKIPLATQRARTGRLKLKDLTTYFEFPIEEAARKMSLCPTVLKKICRRNGVNRWPYRKIRSFKSKIAKAAKLLESNINDEEKARALMTDIQNHRQGLDNIYDKFTQEIEE